VKPFLDLCAKFPDAEKFLFIANMHSLTTVQDGSLRQNAINSLKLFLACGADPEQVFIYNQADVPGHAQLARVLSCITHMGFMERMHAYKDKVANNKANEASVGLFTYPILMAADIILYDATLVPTGQDQKQHVEFARDIAQKFNTMFGETFVLPDSYIQKEVAVVPGIDGRKMSKSYKNFIGMLDDEKTISKKVKQIATDTTPIQEPKNPDTCNIFNIMKLLLTPEEESYRRKRYTDGGLSYKDAKDALFEKIIAFIAPIQEKYKSIADEDIIAMLANNADRANAIASKKIADVYKKV
jgi:tryptophanyl-tRNA synthetase